MTRKSKKEAKCLERNVSVDEGVVLPKIKYIQTSVVTSYPAISDLKTCYCDLDKWTKKRCTGKMCTLLIVSQRKKSVPFKN